jgi:hypothetical protein
MPFVSKSQIKLCYFRKKQDEKAGRVPKWNCSEWYSETSHPDKLPLYKSEKNSSKRRSKRKSTKRVRKMSLVKGKRKTSMRKRKTSMRKRKTSMRKRKSSRKY